MGGARGGASSDESPGPVVASSYELSFDATVGSRWWCEGGEERDRRRAVALFLLPFGRPPPPSQRLLLSRKRYCFSRLDPAQPPLPGHISSDADGGYFQSLPIRRTPRQVRGEVRFPVTKSLLTAEPNRASYRAAKALLHAESGDPIVLGSKPLRVVVRQRQGREAEAWCAESGFLVRRVGLEVS